MKKIRIAHRLAFFATVFWIGYNTYFGWNIHPESELESTLDNVYSIAVAIAIVFYLYPILGVYEGFIKKWEDNK